MEIKTKYVKCSCSTPEHDIRFDMDYNEPLDVWMGIYLNQYYNFFQRVWVALKYIFGTHQTYGHFDTTSLDIQQADEIIKILQDFKKLNVVYMANGNNKIPLTDEEIDNILKT